MTPVSMLGVISAASFAGAVLSCVPGMHICTMLAPLLLLVHAFSAAAEAPPWLGPATVALTAAFAMTSTIPSTLLSAPDESAMFTVLPGQRLLMAGRGYEAVIMTGAGNLAAALGIVIAAPFAASVLPALHEVLRPHFPWIVWTVILFMLLSEWPKTWNPDAGGWRALRHGSQTSLAGIGTFLLSGLLGFILFHRPPLPAALAWQSLMPAFLGLFTVPWLLLNTLNSSPVPPQSLTLGPACRLRHVGQGSLAGMLGGGFAALFPGLTGGVGAMLAGHATSLRGEYAFLASQGASRLTYYAGCLLLLFVPGLGVARGGSAAMLRSFTGPGDPSSFRIALAAVAVSAALAFLLLPLLTRAFLRVLLRTGHRRMSALSLIVIVVLAVTQAGAGGIPILVVAAAIGLIPLLYGARRINNLGVILLPLACGLSGIGDTIARLLGLS